MESQRYRVAWHKKVKVSSEIPIETRPEFLRINYGSWQASRDLVQAWVDEMNTKYPSCHHYVDSETV